MRSRKGFTLIEAVTATFVAMFIFLGAWSIYMMTWRWWKETAPRVEAQRIARITLASVIWGTVDTTAGTYSVGAATYGRRNGIYGATAVPTMPNSHQIEFRLEPDASNVRSFYLGLDAASGSNALYYRDNNANVTMLPETLGISDLTFEKYMGNDNMITVTATADIANNQGSVVYSELVCLRNI